MLTIGPLAVLVPAALIAVLALPALWWLLRATPPAPLSVRFPAIRFLLDLARREETPARTPLWLVILRLLLVLAVIIGVAHPVLDADRRLGGSGPVVLVVDDGWAAAAGWPERQRALFELIDAAERDGRGVVIATTAPPAPSSSHAITPSPLTAREARDLAGSLRPKPWRTERVGAIEALGTASADVGWPRGDVVWLHDGLAEPPGSPSFAELAARLSPLGRLRVLVENQPEIRVVRPREGGGEQLLVTVERPETSAPELAVVTAIDADGRPLAREVAQFDAGDNSALMAFALPSEMRARLQRFAATGRATAASTVLIDGRWQRRPVGLVTEAGAEAEQPYLGSLYYLDRALTPLAEVRRGGVPELLQRELAALVLADADPADAAVRDALEAWVRGGGILLRFAGPSLVRNPRPDDPLLPVTLRGGDRVMGGALSWRAPARLAPFEAGQPLAGLAIPDDVAIRRQVLAEPSLDLAERTWARLDDGTPLITGRRLGDGWVILVHTTADPSWSDLPLSGLFVEILERVVGLASGVAPIGEGPPLAPRQILDAFGALSAPPPSAAPIARALFAETEPGPDHPPGYYGSGGERRALNLSASLGALAPLGDLPPSAVRQAYGESRAHDFRPALFVAAMVLFLIDLAASLWLRGLLRMGMARGVGHGFVVALLSSTAQPVAAQQIIADGSAAEVSLTTRLAYVVTRDAEVDTVSEAGLRGLNQIVNRRTAAMLGSPVGVDPAVDELAFYPLLYWPLSDTQPMPSAEALARLRAYMRDGGTILFDARERGSSAQRLRALADGLALPPLVPVPQGHVLGRAYYLMSAFPGRWNGGAVWIEPSDEHVNDGVTSVVAGDNDWAGAWAVDEQMRPMFPVVPGGADQREHAYRFGINLIMHVLTGSYKADQVHLPAILERLDK